VLDVLPYQLYAAKTTEAGKLSDEDPHGRA